MKWENISMGAYSFRKRKRVNNHTVMTSCMTKILEGKNMIKNFFNILSQYSVVECRTPLIFRVSAQWIEGQYSVD